MQIQYTAEDLTYYHTNKVVVSWTDPGSIFMVIKVPIVQIQNTVRIYKATPYALAMGKPETNTYRGYIYFLFLNRGCLRHLSISPSAIFVMLSIVL